MSMEELLNKLIEKGWKPRGWNWTPNTFWVEGNSVCWNRGGKKCIRELVAKESGLWQFVCENRMVNYHKIDRVKNIEIWSDKMETELNYGSSDYQARIIESALCDEDKLEEFLLQNIKVGNE